MQGSIHLISGSGCKKPNAHSHVVLLFIAIDMQEITKYMLTLICMMALYLPPLREVNSWSSKPAYLPSWKTYICDFLVCDKIPIVAPFLNLQRLFDWGATV